MPWHVAAREAQVKEVHVTEKHLELEVCVPESSSQGSSKGSLTWTEASSGKRPRAFRDIETIYTII